MNDDTVCTLCGQYGHRASHCPHNQDDARIAPARIWPFGDGYQSQLSGFGKQDLRGQHNVGNGRAMTVVDNSKFAPKHPKAGKPVAGNRAPKGRV